ncbi:hypothetical protein MTR67_022876 [Solanum verrucosum]|uniref:Reverse transcriptase RNase H-like domain-containing protein n=1 Tax=Solanum verrucosum TaxID=315347 RepID=A0AAF0QU56_SOLVR|nr:hypothetical protein MTR67_022876 [Solanum verrucosum]
MYIGACTLDKALYDLGATINLMPLKIFKRLGLEEPKTTNMRLLMADRSIKKLVGLEYDVLVKVDKFVFPEDFLILDCKIDIEIPVTLGRQFFATGKALVDVEGVVASLLGVGSYASYQKKLDLDLASQEAPPPKPSIVEPPKSEVEGGMTVVSNEKVELVATRPVIGGICEFKRKLISALIIIAPNWSLPFEIMCDASGMAFGAVLRQCVNKFFHPIYYDSKTLNYAQRNYIVMEQELLVVMHGFEKFKAYFLGTKVVVHTDHATLQYLMTRKEAKPRLI